MNRDATIDALKGFGIILVCWGHALQSLGNDNYALDYTLYKTIYCVHMPLFFFLSGYVSRKAMSLKFSDLFKNKLKSLYYPSVIAFAICSLILLCIGHYSTFSIKGVIGELTFQFLHYYWFIYALIYCYLVGWITTKISNNLTGLLLSVGIVLIIPSWSYLRTFAYFKGMYPFFVLGIIFRNYSIFDRKLLSSPLLIIPLVVLYMLCVYVADKESFIYTHDFNIIAADIHKNTAELGSWFFIVVSGMAGIVILFYIFRKFAGGNLVSWLKDIGLYTLSIYLTQEVAFNVMRYYHIRVKCSPLLQFVIIFIIALAITLAIYRCSRLYKSVRAKAKAKIE